MSGRNRKTIDLGSQDLSAGDMRKFRQAFLDYADGKGKHQELIMFSAGAKPYQYSSMDQFERDLGSIPGDAEYFYYTLTLHGGDRCSLYLDPDRPARVVVEGGDSFVEVLTGGMEKAFPKGGSRYIAHGTAGYFIIWGAVVAIAVVFLISYALAIGSEVNPYLIAWVIFVSSLLGIYLSIVKSREINPANTMVLGSGRKRPMIDIFLHFITVSLGIISVILVLLFVEFNLS
jgi:hypothetical protein